MNFKSILRHLSDIEEMLLADKAKAIEAGKNVDNFDVAWRTIADAQASLAFGSSTSIPSALLVLNNTRLRLEDLNEDDAAAALALSADAIHKFAAIHRFCGSWWCSVSQSNRPCHHTIFAY